MIDPVWFYPTLFVVTGYLVTLGVGVIIGLNWRVANRRREPLNVRMKWQREQPSVVRYLGKKPVRIVDRTPAGLHHLR